MAGDAKNTPSQFGGFRTFYGSDDFSDLTVVCGTRKWRVHKLVVSANCSFFRKTCASGSKVSIDASNATSAAHVLTSDRRRLNTLSRCERMTKRPSLP